MAERSGLFLLAGSRGPGQRPSATTGDRDDAGTVGGEALARNRRHRTVLGSRRPGVPGRHPWVPQGGRREQLVATTGDRQRSFAVGAVGRGHVAPDTSSRGW
jgi:hypothetical protein